MMATQSTQSASARSAHAEEIPGTPVLPEAAMHLHPPTAPAVGTVVATRRCTSSAKAAGIVRHVSIDISGSKLAGKFLPGQAFGVLPPGVDARGLAHKLRLYSIASPSHGEDGQGNVIATTIKRLIDEHHETHKLYLGVASNYLCDLSEGDKVQVTGPSGKRFLLPAEPSKHDYIFFATGTGIAPFRAMLLDLAKRREANPGAPTSRVTLVMGSPYATDLLYHKELLELQDRLPGFTYLTAVSREAQSDGKPAMYVQDRLHHSRDVLIPMLESQRTLVYVCGIAGMELGIFQGLAKALGPGHLPQYLGVDAAAGEPKGWDRRMIHKQVRPTRRVFLEVY